MERGGWKQQPNIELAVAAAPACPRCGSSNTKFCYYNNYSLTQPRYFCKACRRYWTKGGSLRNVPVGGGCRKTRRPKSTRATAAPPNSNNPFQQTCTTSISLQPSTTIDLAAVYANFLNQPPPPRDIQNQTTLSELPGAGIGELSSFQSLSAQENGFFECGSFTAQLLGHGGGNSFAGMNEIIDGDVLPPLPGQAMWPSSDMILQNQMEMLPMPPSASEVEPLINSNTQQNSELLFNAIEHHNPFTGFNLEAFFG
ncbi:hypothetical protein C2S51_031002 [Perilla frutescens var. frutescens]|nr:hypothetical protein C2S51_031002 [Perilla frutescens var. frutescens]